MQQKDQMRSCRVIPFLTKTSIDSEFFYSNFDPFFIEPPLSTLWKILYIRHLYRMITGLIQTKSVKIANLIEVKYL